MDPISLLASIKTGIAAGKTVAGLSKQIGQFFDATDSAKKKLQKRVLPRQMLILLHMQDGNLN